MPKFRYLARTADGSLQRGMIESLSEATVRAQLQAAAMVAVEVSEDAEPAEASDVLRQLFAQRKVNSRDRLLFCRQMHALTKAGVPMNRAIGGLMSNSASPPMIEVLKGIQQELDAGQPLSSGLARYPKAFPPLMISIVRVGEDTGSLDLAFMRLQDYLEFEEQTVRRARSAMRYPMMVVASTIAALIGMLWFVVPTFSSVFKNAGVSLPLPTQFVLSLSDFVAGNIGVLAVLTLLLIASWRAWLMTEEGRLRWDGYKLRLPIVGEILLMSALARFGRALSISYASGVPVLRCLQSVGDALGNELLRQKITAVRQRIEEGMPLSRATESQGLFTPLVVQMLAVGEETGRIDEMMNEVAEFYEREVEYRVDNLSSAIEPIMLFIVGCLVLLLALAIFLPIWKMTSLA